MDEHSNTEDFLDFDESTSSRDGSEDVSIDELFNAMKIYDENFSTNKRYLFPLLRLIKHK